MSSLQIRRALLALVVVAGFMNIGHAADFDQTHAALNPILQAHVKDGLVSYARLKADRTPLDAYLSSLAEVTEAEFRRWPENERLAFLINLYNATTLQLIIDHYPVGSIKEIGSFLKGPWDQSTVDLFGRTRTLNDLEHKIIRVDYQEPRIHVALVCAAKGCPPLRNEAYIGDHLEAQLAGQVGLFLANARKNRVDADHRTVYLSPIFKWYGEDFEKKSGTVLKALQPYWPKADQENLRKGSFRIRYTDYDWSLNNRNP